MKSLFFDAGPVISLATNNLLGMLEKLKSKYGGQFYFSGAVKKELIDVPYNSKRFKFEAIQIMRSVERGVFTIVPPQETAEFTKELLNLANNIYYAKGTGVRIVHSGEIDSLAGAKLMNSDATVIDERTTRMLLEDPYGLKNLVEQRLHTPIRMDEGNLEKFRKSLSPVKIIRSAELVAVAYEMGLFDDYLPSVPQAKRELLDGLLWGIKLNGCAVSKEEINKIIKFELKKQKSI